MTIRGTSNATIKTISGEIKSQNYEVGSANPGGGAGFPQAGSAEYREVDNANPGVWFIPAGEWLPIGISQVQTVGT